MKLRGLLLTLALILGAIFCFSTCRKNPIGPDLPVPPDTTSHNFTWTSTTLGEGNSSVLYDVAIVSDTLAYAVGELYLRDSVGQFDPQPYGVAIWNGTGWRLKRVFVSYPNQPSTSLRPTGISAFSATDVWFAWYDVFQWNGSSKNAQLHWLRNQFGNTNPILDQNQGINRLWGTSGRDLYGCGVNGGLARFDGDSWMKLVSGTTTDIIDLWGVQNLRSNVDEVYCVVSSYFQPGDRKILRTSQTNIVDTVGWQPQRELASVWTNDFSSLYVCGDGVFQNNMGNWKEISLGANIFSTSVRGIASNDVTIVGDFGLVAHYNGQTWRLFSPQTSGTFLSVSMHSHTVIAVGRVNDKAVVTIGKRF